MDNRVERIKELLSKKEEIERELDDIRVQLKEEKLAFSSTRKPRKPRKQKGEA